MPKKANKKEEEVQQPENTVDPNTQIATPTEVNGENSSKPVEPGAQYEKAPDGSTII